MLKVFTIGFLGLLLFACTSKYDDRTYTYSPKGDRDIVFYFNRGVSNSQLNDFLKTIWENYLELKLTERIKAGL